MAVAVSFPSIAFAHFLDVAIDHILYTEANNAQCHLPAKSNGTRVLQPGVDSFELGFQFPLI
jgi:hypothetical protein